MRFQLCLLAVLSVWLSPPAASAGESTRVTDAEHHACTHPGGYPYREKSDFVLGELDLEPGDVVVDIGAGDGWWSKRMAEEVTEEGLVYAAEVDQKKVDQLKKVLDGLPQAKPYLCPFDGTGLPENSCDLAFFSKVYHHLNEGGHVDYLRHLRSVVKPTGRLCIIEKYPEIATNRKTHGWSLSLLVKQAEEAGWIPVRCELMRGTYHYLAVFVQKDLFPPEPSRARGRAQAATN